MTTAVSAQCSITTSRNTTGLTCGTSPLSTCGGILYIGDGTNAMILTMTSNLNLSCLGPIRFIIKNGASVDFSTGNYDLQLAAGSSIEIESGGQLGAATNCSASDLVKIGDVNVASCNGSGGGVLTDFPGLVSSGGYSSVNATASPTAVCDSGIFTLTATSNPSSGATYKWYTTASGGTSIYTGSTYTTPTITSTTNYYVEASYTSPSYTTIRKAVTATVNTSSVAPTSITGTTTICNGTSTTLNLSGGIAGTGATAQWFSGSCGGTSVGTGNSITVSPASNTTYYVRYSGTCNTTTCASATVTVAPSSVGGTIAGGTTPICESSSSGTLTLSGYAGTITQWERRVNSGTWSNIGNYNIATYSEIPSSGGTWEYRALLQNGSCTAVYSSVKAIVVNSKPSNPAVGTITQPTCSTSTGSFTITNYNASYSYIVSPSTGVSISAATITAPAGTYSIYASLSGCTSENTNFVINSQPTTPSAPVVGAITQPNCTLDTGSVILSGLPSGTWILTRSGTSAATTTGTGTSTTISGLIDGGGYTFTVSNGSCTSVSSNIVNIDNISTITSTWNGSSWTNGVPDNSKRIVFSGNFSSTENIIGCSCKVTSGANVVFNSGHTLTVTNGIDIQTNGSLTFENNASLVQINDAAVNTGNINYKRYTSAVKRYDFTYWSSPVAAQTLKNLSPNTLYDKYYSYNPTSGWKVEYNGAATMVPGTGYIIRAPQTFSITAASIDSNPVFIGKPNNGIISFSIAGNQVHLLGNPYPSALDADAFLDLNAGVLEGTLYFWTHNSSPSSAVAGDATYNYTTNDYATYNRTGGVTTATAVTGVVAPTGKIAAGQGFFAPTSVAGGTLTFNNSMRLSSTGTVLNNSQFFKVSSTSKTGVTTEKNRVWLNLSNVQGAFKQTLVGYITGATNDYDGGFDGVTYDGNTFVDFYSVNQSVNLSIQGRALPFVKKDSVVLGYKSTIKGEFQISIDHTDGALASQNIFVEDKVLQVLHDLKKGSYTFSTEVGVFNNRFVLRYVDKNVPEEVVVEPEVPEVLNEAVLVSVQDNGIKINSPADLLVKVIVYDVTGKNIYQKNAIDANELLIEHLIATHQVLVVDVFLYNGTKISRKVIY